MSDNTNIDAEASRAMLKNLNKRINEHVLNDKPMDGAWLELRDQLMAEVSADDGYEINVYAQPLTPFGDDM